MSDAELRDELVTALVAGHETTASQLAWAFERIARERDVQARLHAELDAAPIEAYLTATINEILRRRPVLPNAEPRLVKQPIEIGGIEYSPDVVLFASAYLLHHDEAVYPDPYAFRPERFLDEAPGTYTWIPFGGGRRRCLGASFALLEMKLVLRAVLERCELRPGGQRARGHAPARDHVQPVCGKHRDPQRQSARAWHEPGAVRTKHARPRLSRPRRFAGAVRDVPASPLLRCARSRAREARRERAQLLIASRGGAPDVAGAGTALCTSP